ncbi:methyltransferase family protein [Vibrio maerlii]|uniref:methyltransferase family protein n=1 Tax=Vibrio maerlii TaxID=2231648 RepID=UPI000E3C922B|nr:isoprenylcysteine carboxylmethyltransferase family protein [Vibrio maerlii]
MLDKKIPPPIVMLCFALLMWWCSRLFSPIELDAILTTSLAFLLTIIGILIDVTSLYWFWKHKTTINPLNPDATSSLVSKGTYKFSRNPMYLGLVFFLTAWAVYLTTPLCMLGVAGFIVYITIFQIKPEEQALEQHFGEEYRHYKARVRRWI